jgi:hypothetical protein
MVFLPPGTPYNILESSATIFQRVMDGGPIGPAPHTICDIIEAFTLDGIEYKPGMQGETLDEVTNQKGEDLIKIFVEGVTETGPKLDDFVKWVPFNKLKIGCSDWKGSTEGFSVRTKASVGAASTGSLKDQPGFANNTVGKAS